MGTVLANNDRRLERVSFLETLFSNPRAALLWLPVRIWLGWQWVEAASHKTSNPAWVETGAALKGYWTGAVAIPETGRPAIAFDWYRGFIQAMLDAEAYTWFAKLIAYGELLIGIALIVGAFTGVALAFSALMNWNFMMAGSASTNPMLFLVAVVLLLAWRVVGKIGLDFFIPIKLATPWGKPSSHELANALPAGE